MMIPAQDSARRPKEHLEEHNTNEKDAVFIIDEAHQAFERTFDEKKFADVYFKNRRYKVACFSTSSTDEFGTTPEVLKPHKFWYFGPTSDRDVAASFIGRVLESVDISPNIGKNKGKQTLGHSLFDYCGAHMEVMLVTLRLMLQNNLRLPSVMSVLNSDYPPRVVVNGSDPWTDEHKTLAGRLLAAGTMTTKQAHNKKQLDLIRKGFIAPVRPLSSTSQIVKFSEGVELSWAHSWQVIASQLQEVEALPSMKTGKVSIDRPLELLLYVLPFFDINELFGSRIAGYTSKHGQNSPASEYNFQGALRGSIARALPHFSCIPEFLTGPRGRIDFVVFPVKRETQWGFELLLDSDKINEHKNRFDGGKYDQAGCTDHLVIDCRTKPVPSTETIENNEKLVTIAPHQLRGWDVIEVRCPTGEKLAVPRDCVPRVKRDGKLVPVLCVDESKLTPKTVWVKPKLGGEPFKVAPLSNHISSLKKAIKAKESLTVEPRNIKVFEWDIATNAGKSDAVVTPNTPLHANTVDTPYTFSAPPKAVWVKPKEGGEPFDVASLSNHISSLKKAIKEEESLTVKASIVEY